MTTASRVSRTIVVLSYLAIGFIVMGYAARSASAQVLYGSIVGTLERAEATQQNVMSLALGHEKLVA